MSMTTASKHLALMALMALTALAGTACTKTSHKQAATDAGTDANQQADSGPTKDAAAAGDASSGRDGSASAADGGDSDAMSPRVCTIDGALHFGSTGGLSPSQTTAELSSTGTLTITRSTGGSSPSSASCTSKLPACGSASIDLVDLAADLDNADVKAAFAMASPPSYGQVAADGATFLVKRADGKSFTDAIGSCAAGDSSCTPAPAGVQTFVDHLQSIEIDAVLSSACAHLIDTSADAGN
jgi:hypothetical protein